MRALLDAGDLDDVADTYAHMAEATVRMLERSGRLSERAATRLRAALALGDLEDE
jgi:hypothetical protein